MRETAEALPDGVSVHNLKGAPWRLVRWLKAITHQTVVLLVVIGFACAVAAIVSWRAAGTQTSTATGAHK